MDRIDRDFVKNILPARDPGGHKGTFGKVLCVGGSVGYTGAPIFASRAAVRTGSGLVFLVVPESIWQVAAVKSDEAMPFPMRDMDGKLTAALTRSPAVPKDATLCSTAAALDAASVLTN